MVRLVLENPIFVWIKRTIVIMYYIIKYRKLHLKIGSQSIIRNCKFGLYSTIYKNVRLSDVFLGNFSYIGPNSVFTKTKIGNFTCIGEGVECGLGVHPTSKFVSIHPIFYSNKKQVQISFAKRNYFEEHKSVDIGNDVWIGNGATIFGGVRVGDGAVIGAKTIITKDIPPYAIVAGVPAKIIRFRFSKEDIQSLMQFQWWGKDIKWLKNNFKIMHDINQFKIAVLERNE